MDDTAKRARINAFISDKELNQAVYDVLLGVFRKRKSGEDTQIKAARFIAMELLDEGWSEFERYKVSGDNTPKNGNVGL